MIGLKIVNGFVQIINPIREVMHAFCNAFKFKSLFSYTYDDFDIVDFIYSRNGYIELPNVYNLFKDFVIIAFDGTLHYLKGVSKQS